MPFDKDIHVKNQFTGSDYRGKHGKASTSVGNEAGWSAKVYRAALGAVAGLSMMAAAERAAVADMIVDLNWRLAGDYSNVAYLADKTTLDPAVIGSGIFDQPYGPVRFESTGDDVPIDWKLIFMDSGNQPVGMVFTRLGYYNTYQSLGTAVYGNDPDTPIDEGATMNTDIWVMAEDPTGNIYESHFTSPFTFIDRESPRLAHIHVTDNKIPEPTSLALLAAGAGAAIFTRRRRK